MIKTGTSMCGKVETVNKYNINSKTKNCYNCNAYDKSAHFCYEFGIDITDKTQAKYCKAFPSKVHKPKERVLRCINNTNNKPKAKQEEQKEIIYNTSLEKLSKRMGLELTMKDIIACKGYKYLGNKSCAIKCIDASNKLIKLRFKKSKINYIFRIIK